MIWFSSLCQCLILFFYFALAWANTELWSPCIAFSLSPCTLEITVFLRVVESVLLMEKWLSKYRIDFRVQTAGNRVAWRFRQSSFVWDSTLRMSLFSRDEIDSIRVCQLLQDKCCHNESYGGTESQEYKEVNLMHKLISLHQRGSLV